MAREPASAPRVAELLGRLGPLDLAVQRTYKPALNAGIAAFAEGLRPQPGWTARAITEDRVDRIALAFAQAGILQPARR